MQCIGRTKTLKRCKNPAKRFFCTEHKFQPLKFFVIFLGIVSGLVGVYRGAIEQFIYSEKLNVTVSPNQITPTLDTWKNYHSFSITNPTKKAAYAVWVQISVVEKRTTSEKIYVDNVIRSSDGASFVVPDKRESPPKAVLITGKSAKRLPSLFLVIRSLGPESSLGFEILAKSRSEADNKNVSIKYLLDILSFSETPDRFRTKVKHRMMFFDKMPKGLTVNARDEHYILFLE